MKKNLCLTLALLLCVAMLAGCGSNNNSGDDKSSVGDTPSTTNTHNVPDTPENTEDNAAAPTNEGVKITDVYTFDDPTDLEFDTRYVLYMGPNSEFVAVSAEKGQIGQYTIIYAKEERAMGEYSLYVCDSAESAEAMLSEMQGYGMPVELVDEDHTLICVFSDEYILEANISIYQMAEMISDTTASAYAQMYVTAYGAEMQ